MDEFFNEQAPEVTLAVSRKDLPRKTSDEGHLTVDVYQTDDDIVVRSTIAGARIEDIDIQVTQEMITIKGHRKPEEPISSDQYYHRELYWGPFSRAIVLPVDVDHENAKASYKNGILTIRLPKLEKVRTKKLKISS
jgi:HSP20 family protein